MLTTRWTPLFPSELPFISDSNSTMHRDALKETENDENFHESNNIF